MLQAVNVARLEVPSYDRFLKAGIARHPGVDEQTWGINFQILASHAESLAILAHAFVQVLAADPKIGLRRS